jgi:hypothetical protein
MEGSGCGLIWGTMPTFACRDWEKSRSTSVGCSLYPGRDLNQGPPKHEAGVITLRYARTVWKDMMSPFFVNLYIYRQKYFKKIILFADISGGLTDGANEPLVLIHLHRGNINIILSTDVGQLLHSSFQRYEKQREETTRPTAESCCNL